MKSRNSKLLILFAALIAVVATFFASKAVYAWILTTASYDSVSFSVTSQDATPHLVFFKPDGLKMYVLGQTSDSTYQYSLPSAWNVSTASYDSISTSTAWQETGTRGLFFKPDGTKMYTIGTSNDTVFQHSLSSAWNIGTAVYDNVSFPVASQETNPASLFFRPDGLKMYVSGFASDAVFQYSLSSAWDVSTASYDSVSFSIASQDAPANRNIFFKPNGTKMYLMGQTADTLYQYSLSTGWDLSTASYDSVSFSVTSQESSPNGVFMKPDGTKMYVLGQTSDSVFQYSLTPDTTAPSYSTYTPSSGATTFSLTFTSDESALSTLSYGLLSGARVATTTQATTTSHTHSLTGLASCASYQYALTLTDGDMNASSSPYTFMTTGCPTSASVATSSQARIATTTGGTATLEDVTLTIPIGYSTSTTSFQINRLDTAAVIASLGTPVTEDQNVGDHIFDLSAFISATTSTSTFMQNITIAIDYDTSDISGLDPSSISMYSSDGSAWQELTCTLDQNNTSISCTTNHFSTFGLFGTASPSSSSGSTPTLFSSGGRSTASREAYLRALYATNNLPYPGDTSPVVTPVSITRTLKQGSTGEDVRILQRLLNAKGFTVSTTGPGSPGNETTLFGPATLAAVKRLQCSSLHICSGTTATTGYGLVGPRTKAELVK